MVPFAIAGLQAPVAHGTDNIPALRRSIGHGLRRFPWVQMVVLSELAAYGYLPAQAEPPGGAAETAFREIAARHAIWLVSGSHFERVDDKLYNTALVIDPSGAVVARYRKMFPFLPYETGIAAGTEFCVFDVPAIGRFGLSICYDMWFPETTRTLAAMGAEVILHPSLTDTIDRELELQIARVSAGINQCYFFDINGVEGGGVGRSIIIDPSGYVLHEAGAGAEFMPVEIDLERVRRQRATGLRGACQVLKSFRDRPVEFPVYQRDSFDNGFLDSLGPLDKPARGGREGLP
jgi:predicted amidohydrolase